MKGTRQRMAKLLYGSGIRLMERIRLRVRDLNFSSRLIYARLAMAVPRATALLTAGVEMPSRPAMAVMLSLISRPAQ